MPYTIAATQAEVAAETARTTTRTMLFANDVDMPLVRTFSHPRGEQKIAGVVASKRARYIE